VRRVPPRNILNNEDALYITCAWGMSLGWQRFRYLRRLFRIARGIERLAGAYGSVLGKYQRARRVRAIERSPFGPPGVQLLPAGVPSPRFYLSRAYTRVIKERARKFKSTGSRRKGLNEWSGLFMIEVRIRVPLTWPPIDVFSLNRISLKSSTASRPCAKLYPSTCTHRMRLFHLSRSPRASVKILGSSPSTSPVPRTRTLPRAVCFLLRERITRSRSNPAGSRRDSRDEIDQPFEAHSLRELPMLRIPPLSYLSKTLRRATRDLSSSRTFVRAITFEISLL